MTEEKKNGVKPILVFAEEECAVIPCTHFYCEDEKQGVMGMGRGGFLPMGGDGADDFVLGRFDSIDDAREEMRRLFEAMKRGDSWIIV